MMHCMKWTSFIDERAARQHEEFSGEMEGATALLHAGCRLRPAAEG